MHTLLAQIQIRNGFHARVEPRSEILDGVSAIRRAKAESPWIQPAAPRAFGAARAAMATIAMGLGSVAAFAAHR